MSGCCPASPEDYSRYAEGFVTGRLPTLPGPVPVVSTTLTLADRLGGWRVRWNVGRSDHRVRPGLYAVGSPDDSSPVLVSANYKLSFDALRGELGGVDAWILVIDTRGVNVWCAAGKGTFGTAEIVSRVRRVGLAQVVSHQVLVVPQLGAPGVAAHEVRAGCGFRVVYGPVRARDILAFLAAGMSAEGGMRRVGFTLKERLALVPVELSALWRPRALLFAFAAVALGAVGPWGYSAAEGVARGGALVAAVALGVFAGALVTPALLPWIPGRMFSVKGALAGAVLAGPLLLAAGAGPLMTVWALAAVTAVSSFAAMNFTGSTTFTSLSGVLVEMRRSLPWQVGAGVFALAGWVAAAFVGGLA